MNPKLPKTTWSNFHSGHIPQKPKSYSLVYKNGNVVQGVVDKPYAYCLTVKKSYPNAEIKPNYQ